MSWIETLEGKAAIELARRDMRVHRHVESATAEALQSTRHGDGRLEAARIAALVAVSRLVGEGELAAVRAEREHYRQLALRGLDLGAPPPIFVTNVDPSGQNAVSRPATLEEQAERALRGAESWLHGWAVHAGNCAGDRACTCGLIAIRHETASAVDRYNHEENPS